MLDDEEAWMVERIYNNSHISKRYSVLTDVLLPAKNQPPIGMSARNTLYKREAPPLAEKAAREALKQWGGPLSAITHVLSVSCTGAITPGLEFKLAQTLGLDPYVTRLGINFMGCFGAFKGLSVAHKIACDKPANRILMVCTELCTLHFRPGESIESTVIHSLFADGAAAAIVGAVPRPHEQPKYEMLQEKSIALKDSEQEMTWDAGDYGFDMTLSARVPALIEQHIKGFVDVLAPNQLQHNIEWAVHPGGKAIIEAVEKALALKRNQTESSWSVLSQYGNMSSATILYVLEHLMNKKDLSPLTVALGFGPGLSIEGLLLRNCSTSGL
jgi:predicted naringenin-chalcone synthase